MQYALFFDTAFFLCLFFYSILYFWDPSLLLCLVVVDWFSLLYDIILYEYAIHQHWLLQGAPLIYNYNVSYPFNIFPLQNPGETNGSEFQMCYMILSLYWTLELKFILIHKYLSTVYYVADTSLNTRAEDPWGFCRILRRGRHRRR